MSALDLLRFGGSRRLPLILQSETAECGLACLAMVGGFHGHEIDLASLRRQFNVGQAGTSIKSLARLAEQLKLSAQTLKLDLPQIKALKCPCILHWRFNHFVVLESVLGSEYIIHDPARGRRKVAATEMDEAFTGLAVELWPTAEFVRKKERQRVRIRDLVGQIRGLRVTFAHVLALALSLEVFALTSPLFLQWVVDVAIVSADHDLLTVLVWGFALLLLIQVVLAAARAWLLMYISMTVNVQWLDNVFRHLVKLPMSFFQRRHLGDVVSRFDAVRIIQRIVTTQFVEAILDGLLAGLTLLVMFIYSPLLAAIVVASSAIYVALRSALYSPLRQKAEERTVMTARETSHFFETVRGMQGIKLFGLQERRRNAWLGLVAASANRDIKVQRLNIGFRAANGTLSGVENLLVVWLAAKLVIAGTFSVGMVYAFIAYKAVFATRITALIDKYFEFRMLGLQTERLSDIVLNETEDREVHEIAEESAPIPADASIEIANVSFRYSDSEPWVLRDCSFKVSSGESVAIVGPSGCGKTTLAKLILGLLEPSEGEIRIGGVPIKKLGLEAYRRMAGAVMQDDMLFMGTIAENIGIASESFDRDLVTQSAKLAAVDAEIRRMPMGYEGLIGDMGTALSGGQKQRILIARALYKQPIFLVLDEATSHLDVANERAVNGAIQALRLTRIVIAHRPETIQSAGRVIRLEGGAALAEMRVLRGEPAV